MAARKTKPAETNVLPENEVKTQESINETESTVTAEQKTAPEVTQTTEDARTEDAAEGLLVEELRLPYRVAHCTSLNLRAAPSKAAEVLQVLPEGTVVLARSFSWIPDGTAVWISVDCGDLSGYVMGQYLAPVEG